MMTKTKSKIIFNQKEPMVNCCTYSEDLTELFVYKAGTSFFDGCLLVYRVYQETVYQFDEVLSSGFMMPIKKDLI